MRWRLSIIGFAVVLIIANLVAAEIPQMISYQGKATDAGGVPVADGSYNMRFRIYDSETAGTLEWDSGVQSVTVADGIFNVLLGESPMPSLDLPFDQDYWLWVTFSGINQLPRQRIASSGYAYMASGLVPGTEVAGDVYVTGDLGVGTAVPEAKLHVSDESAPVVRIDPGSNLTVDPMLWLRDTNPYGGLKVIYDNDVGCTYFDNQYDGPSGDMYFRTRVMGTPVNVLTLDASGSVGIGTTSIQNMLTVNGTANFAGSVGVGTPSPQASLHAVSSGGTGVLGIGHTGVVGDDGSTASDGTGVWGTSSSTYGFGVYGTSDHYYGTGVYGYALSTYGSTNGVCGVANSTDGYGVYYTGGLAGSGSKSCVVKTSQGPTLMYCQESPECWFEDFGEGQLVNGRTHIELDPLFVETVVIDGDNPMKVFIQPLDECNGTRVLRGYMGFDVVELNGGRSNSGFMYRVIAKRRGFEEKRLDYCKAGERDQYLFPELREHELRKFREEHEQLETRTPIEEEATLQTR